MEQLTNLIPIALMGLLVPLVRFVVDLSKILWRYVNLQEHGKTVCYNLTAFVVGIGLSYLYGEIKAVKDLFPNNSLIFQGLLIGLIASLTYWKDKRKFENDG